MSDRPHSTHSGTPPRERDGVPPVLSPVTTANPASARPISTPLAGLVGVPLLIAMVSLAMTWNFPLPHCMFKALTGIPCFTCGTTRALAALGRFDFQAAFHFNPLAAFLCFAIPSGCALRIAVEQVPGLRGRIALPNLRVLLGLAAAAGIANWLYILKTLPR